MENFVGEKKSWTLEIHGGEINYAPTVNFILASELLHIIFGLNISDALTIFAILVQIFTSKVRLNYEDYIYILQRELLLKNFLVL